MKNSLNRVATLRLSKGLTQKQLSEIIEVSESTIAMYETGQRTPPLDKAKRIADYFGTTIEYIFFSLSAHEEYTRVNRTNKTSKLA